MCDCDKELGELRLRLDALYKLIEEQDKRIKRLERDDPRTTWTVTPAPVWDA